MDKRILIDKWSAVYALRKMIDNEPKHKRCINRYIEKIIEQQTVDDEPIRHGHWIFHTFEEVMNGDWIVLRDWRGNGFECSNCGRLIAEIEMAYKFKYCPNCGAKMHGLESENEH